MSKTHKKPQRTRAEIAAERGIGIRTLQRQVATELAALPLEFKRQAARVFLLTDRVNRILPVLLNSKDTAALKELRDATLPGAIAVLGILAPEVLAAMKMEDAAPCKPPALRRRAGEAREKFGDGGQRLAICQQR